MSLKSRLMPLYRRAPPSVRNVVGSVYGGYLNYWRYGRDSARLVDAALAREHWSKERWEAWQDERLAELLRHAARDVPYYREAWRERRLMGDDSPVDQLENWPVLSKETLRADPKLFIADSRRGRRLFRLDTSGTSGTPITTWRSRETMQAWYALVEARWRRWYGVSRHEPWAILGGQEVTPVEREVPPYWLWNRAGQQLYMSTLHLKAANVASYLDALRTYGISHLYAYSSAAAELARLASQASLETPKLKVVVTNAEPLEPHQRETIATAFDCPVHSSYGMSEAVAGASECKHGRLHLWPEAGVVEVMKDFDDELVANGTSGRLICTGLLNFDMPLIRYEIGDRGALAPNTATEETCDCGREMPQLHRLEGRSIDNLVTSDGRKVFWLNPVLYGLPIHQAQIVQRSHEYVEVKVIPADGYGAEATTHITTELRRRLGDVEVAVRVVDEIERGPNGKFRAVVSEVRDGR